MSKEIELLRCPCDASLLFYQQMHYQLHGLVDQLIAPSGQEPIGHRNCLSIEGGIDAPVGLSPFVEVVQRS